MGSQLITSLRATIDSVVGTIVPPGTSLALLDFPNHANVGDSAIWLGEANWLAQRHNKRRYVCEVGTYDPEVLLRRVPAGPILLHGGGNFGDLWPRHQAFRERVIRDFPDRQIVQLPQTIHFENHRALEASRRAIGSHKNFTLLVRDKRSHSIARSAFDCRVELCPDMAFCLALSDRRRPAAHEFIFIRRLDKEGHASTAFVGVPSDALTVDWPDESGSILRIVARAFTRACMRYPARMAATGPRISDFLARWRLRRGVNTLLKGKFIYSDRLHAHILCVLLGIPHQVIDNSYGKLSGFVDTWTRGSCETAW